MPITRKIAALAGLGLMSVAAISPSSAQAEEFITIGTAGQTGVYYVVVSRCASLLTATPKSMTSAAPRLRQVVRSPISTVSPRAT